jgi:PKD repeat protein
MAQPPSVESPTACDASFTANVDPLNPMKIHFLDQSAGHITLWQWNFGDGSTSTAQNPVHTYQAGGTYFVCLTVSSNDIGNECNDVLCVPVTIHEPGTCVADFAFMTDESNRFKVNFTDKSSGNINAWHWDFGDGTFAEDRNPSHEFPSASEFRVCLTAYNSDSVATCSDTKCDTVRIMPPPECHALFTFKLDSLNKIRNTFIFNNISGGNPNYYLWKFDDGATYETKDVVHHFLSEGSHEVCLTIRKEEHGSIVCSDTLCMTIATPDYFDVGGHLFTGQFPINNPVATGDTGVVHLYRVEGSHIIPWDTNKFTHLGYYTFPGTLNGNYLVKAGLTRGSASYATYFPGYFRQSLIWSAAEVVNISAGNAYLSDIHLLPVNVLSNGPGIIRGKVVRADSKASENEIPYAEIILYDVQQNPLIFTTADQWGKFELDSLPFGAYQIYVEYPGKYSRYTAVWLDSSTPVADSLILEVFSHDVTAVPEHDGRKILECNIFPNPAGEVVNLSVQLVQAGTLFFEIQTMTGITAWTGSEKFMSGQGRITIPLAALKSGIYLLLVRTPDGSPVAVKKLLRY